RAGNARTLQRGSLGAHPRDAERRRPDAVRSFRENARHPPRHRRDWPGFASTGFRPRPSDLAVGAAAAPLRRGQRVKSQRCLFDALPGAALGFVAAAASAWKFGLRMQMAAAFLAIATQSL